MALWTPAEITTEGWFDAADAGTITLSGSAVTQWDDKSGNARHMGDLSQRPTYETAGQNGLNVVALNNSAMSWPGVSLPADDWQFFFAHNQTNPTNSTYGFLFDSTLDRFVVASHYANTNRSAVFAGSWGTITLSPNVAGGQILHYSISATTTQLRDGTQVATSGGYTQHPIGATVQWFDSATGSFPATGKMWEILVIKGAVSVADRQKIEGYLAHKWGLEARLPAAHPYKTTAPQVASTEATGTGSPVTAPVTASGTGEREVTATGNATTAPITASGSGGQVSTITGTGTATTAPITASGTGEREVTGQGAGAIAAITANGTADREITATGIATTAPITATGTGEREVTGSGAATTPPLTASGSASKLSTITGAGSATFAAFTATGVALRVIVLPVPAWRTVQAPVTSRVAKVAGQDPRIATTVFTGKRIVTAPAQNRRIDLAV